MTIERVGLLKFAGNDVTVIGPDIQVGQKAPEFTAVSSRLVHIYMVCKIQKEKYALLVRSHP